MQQLYNYHKLITFSSEHVTEFGASMGGETDQSLVLVQVPQPTILLKPQIVSKPNPNINAERINSVYGSGLEFVCQFRT